MVVFKWFSFQKFGFIALKWSKPEVKWPFHFRSDFLMDIQKPYHFVQFSNGCNKIGAKKSPAEIDHLKTRLVQFSDFAIYCLKTHLGINIFIIINHLQS
jgi:hypothetical protein